MPRTLRPNVLISGSVTLFLFGSVIAAIAVSSTKVIGTPRNEFDGTAEGGSLAYAQSRAGRSERKVVTDRAYRLWASSRACWYSSITRWARCCGISS
jgi:hypothetical protein